MSTVLIDESDMAFGPFPAEDCFRIERAPAYARIAEGVKIAEFVLLLRKDTARCRALIVEAKKSTPHPGTQPRFRDFLEELREKFANSMAFFAACRAGRHRLAGGELPEGFAQCDMGALELRLVLVVKDHRDDWLPPLHDGLRLLLRPLARCWAMGPDFLMVLNESGAKRHGLIVG